MMPKAKVQQDVITAVSACEKDGQGLAALTLFGAMPMAKVQPNVISAVSECEKGGQDCSFDTVWGHAHGQSSAGCHQCCQ